MRAAMRAALVAAPALAALALPAGAVESAPDRLHALRAAGLLPPEGLGHLLEYGAPLLIVAVAVIYLLVEARALGSR